MMMLHYKSSELSRPQVYHPMEHRLSPSSRLVSVPAPAPADPDKVVPAVLPNLKQVREDRHGSSKTLDGLHNPPKQGVGEIWVDAEFEKTAHKTKPGTAIAVDAQTWDVTKRVALPGISLNKPHNMWSDRNQLVIYQTQ
jgi:hypothetical protein